MAAQTELEVLKDSDTQKQNEAVMLQARITELQKQLSNIESGGKINFIYRLMNSLS